MTFLMYVLLFAFVLGLAAVASNPSPYFGALGMAVVSVLGCGVLLHFGSSFLSLVLLMIYLGGMLVVFGYSSAFAADRYPKDWGNWTVFFSFVAYVLLILFLTRVVGAWPWWWSTSWVPSDEQNARHSLSRGEGAGIAVLYTVGAVMLLLSGSALLITLFVVMELTRRLLRGGVRLL
uniref:NADH-ubiquinone oxidoreductase chain 6 n=1 Tax=Lactarius lactarius TaxID=445388 RepID=A0A6M5A5B8_9TELE|nr:NADH dehydrogenase subunit 6 [Lactarius lactarius]